MSKSENMHKYKVGDGALDVPKYTIVLSSRDVEGAVPYFIFVQNDYRFEICSFIVLI